MPSYRADIATQNASLYLQQLCKHWAHKLEVEHSEQDAKIVFASGTCLMHAEPDRLLVSIETLEEEHLDQLEGVVESHLMRMAKDESLEIVWEN